MKILKEVFSFLTQNKTKYVSEKESLRYANENKIDVEKSKLSKNLKSNVKMFKEVFKYDSTFITREIVNKTNPNVKFALFFFDGMTDSDFLSMHLIRPLINEKHFIKNSKLLNYAINSVLTCNEINVIDSLSETIVKMQYGDTLLMIDGFDKAIILSSKGWPKRSIEEPGNEIAVNGPREGFAESILQNITLIKKRILNPNLCIEISKCGKQSNTKYALIYIDGIVNKDVLYELKSRILNIDIDAIIDSNYIEELINENKFSTFKTIGITERPDTVCGKILEGRIALLVDGSPVALTVPYLFLEHFQTSDDYYSGFYFASFERILRMLSFIISISVPSIYLSLVSFHQKAIPINLLLSISSSRQGVPFPTFLEILIFMILFEILREASIRMPPGVSQALGVVGGLVIGQAAVEARFLSAPIIIIIAISGITEIMIPGLKNAITIYKFQFLFYSFFLGIYGYVFGMTKMFLNLFSLKSFGINYMSPNEINSFQDYKDIFIRAPWTDMLTRPTFISKHNVIRQKNKFSKPTYNKRNG